MKCPICGANDWRRIPKRKKLNIGFAEIGVGPQYKEVIIYKCGKCGYEMPSPDENR